MKAICGKDSSGAPTPKRGAGANSLTTPERGTAQKICLTQH